MSLAEVIETTQDITREVNHIFTSVVRMYLTFFSLPARSRSTTSEPDIRTKLWQMRRLLEDTMGEGMEQDFVHALNVLGDRSDEIQKAVVVWVDLIEVLVQDAERRYGTASGRGKLKASEVKAVMRYLLRTDRFDIPKVPEFLEPVLVDWVVDWSIDAIVLVTNDYGLWITTDTSPEGMRMYLKIWWSWLVNLLKMIGYPIAWVGSKIRLALRPRIQLTPEIQAALQAVEREGLLTDQTQILHDLTNLLTWIGLHRNQLIAAVELVFSAVQEAESYLELSGPAKKTYARKLVFAVLDDLGFVQKTGLLVAIIESMTSGLIESAVHLFNKRGVFTHGSSG